MYSVEDRKSFEAAIDSLYELRHDEVNEYSDAPSSVIILVANKVDLVRTRVVLEQGEVK
jgi:GTPase SAR1 family protein